MVILGEENGHACIELANGELHLGWRLRHLDRTNKGKKRRRGTKMKMGGQDRNALSETKRVSEPPPAKLQVLLRSNHTNAIRI